MNAQDAHKAIATISDASKVYCFSCSEYGRRFVVATVTIDPSLGHGNAKYIDDIEGVVLPTADAFEKARAKKRRYA